MSIDFSPPSHFLLQPFCGSSCRTLRRRRSSLTLVPFAWVALPLWVYAQRPVTAQCKLVQTDGRPAPATIVSTPSFDLHTSNHNGVSPSAWSSGSPCRSKGLSRDRFGVNVHTRCEFTSNQTADLNISYDPRVQQMSNNQRRFKKQQKKTNRKTKPQQPWNQLANWRVRTQRRLIVIIMPLIWRCFSNSLFISFTHYPRRQNETTIKVSDTSNTCS